MKRSCGVLLHITSLPSPYGIGTLGKSAEQFVDSLKAAGQQYWQVLPINPVGYGNSPYQSYSAFAGEPLLIDLDELVTNGLIGKSECENADYGADCNFVDFERVARTKTQLLRKAFANFTETAAYLSFTSREAAWLDDYALFMALKTANEGKPWQEWKPEYTPKMKPSEELTKAINFWKFVQFYFYRQWTSLREYANKNGIKLIGDIPIYASPDSADVWINRDLFLLDNDGYPTKVAGVPPDYFSETGQLWGNPLYNWDAMKQDGYQWWIARFEKAAQLYDTVRVDHFRAFDTYYAIPYGEKTAVKGEWLNGPGMDLFNAVKSEKTLADFPIIAEDLGDLFDSVKVLLKQTGFPGMRVLQFGFNAKYEDNEHLPHNYAANTVVYTGTHDNSTVKGYFKDNPKAVQNMAKRYLQPRFAEPLNWSCIRALYASAAETVIVPMQDLLGLDDRARFNRPGTVVLTNWVWRMKGDAFNGRIINKLKDLKETYFR